MIKTLATTYLLFISFIAWSQCDQLSTYAPAFEIDVPTGVQIDSAYIIIDSFYSNQSHIIARARSFNNFNNATPWFSSSGVHPILNQVLVGPISADLQVHSTLDEFCDSPGDSVYISWNVKIFCSGQAGTTLNFSGVLGNSLAGPTNIGSVFAGENTITGITRNILTPFFGNGEMVYYDNDRDNFGDPNISKIICDEALCSDWVTNDLDCDDDNPLINPDATEIPNNGIDEDCDGMDGVSGINEISKANIKIFPNPAKSVIHIESTESQELAISIFDLSGKQILSIRKQHSISVSDLPTGTYLLELKDISTGKKIRERLIIEK